MGKVTRYVDPTAAKINALHSEFLDVGRKTLEIGIRIGKLLEDKKGELGHGNWLPWVEKNLSFSDRTARNYQRLWTNRALLTSANVANLSGAYKLLEVKRDRVDRPITPVVDAEILEEIRPQLQRMNLAHRLRFAWRIVAGR